MEQPSSVEKSIKVMRQEIRDRINILRWVQKHKETIHKCGSEPTFWMGIVDFNNLSHSETLKVIKAFGGKWDKKVSAAGGGGKVDYNSKIDGITVRVYAGEPPPLCKIVEKQVLVPARMETVRELVCPKSILKHK